ncbi:MAG: hypothetical protein ACFE9L_18225 [Candidatus Hodarchaeota archaeon]
MGGVVELMSWLIRLQFDIYPFKEGKDVKVGEFNQRVPICDKYILDMTADTQRLFNCKFAIALAVLLDSAEQR